MNDFTCKSRGYKDLLGTVIYLSVTVVQLSGVSEALRVKKCCIFHMFDDVSNMLRGTPSDPM